MADDKKDDDVKDDKKDDDVKDDAKSEELGEGGKRALDAERKARRTAEKELNELRTKVKEVEDADKSELERLQEKTAAAEKRAETAEAKATRFEVAAEKGLTLGQARRLVGSTKEELEEDADAMRAELGLDKNDDDGKKDDSKNDDDRGLPREKLRSGASNEDSEEPDAGKIAESILSSSI